MGGIEVVIRGLPSIRPCILPSTHRLTTIWNHQKWFKPRDYFSHSKVYKSSKVKSLKNYFRAKLILFEKLLTKNSYVITDKNIPQFKQIKQISQKRQLRKIFVDKFEQEYDFSKFKLIGNFQKKNLMMAIKACEVLGLNKKKID